LEGEDPPADSWGRESSCFTAAGMPEEELPPLYLEEDIGVCGSTLGEEASKVVSGGGEDGEVGLFGAEKQEKHDRTLEQQQLFFAILLKKAELKPDNENKKNRKLKMDNYKLQYSLLSLQRIRNSERYYCLYRKHSNAIAKVKVIVITQRSRIPIVSAVKIK
jgi:hypothetical protein